MKVLGVVAEYNPFHNGHKYHIECAKKLTGCDFVVCVMSGNFIQRGEPAIVNKWARTKMTLMNGIDLVIELPVSYVLQSAESFAFGAVKILDSLGIVDFIVFGSESGQIEPLSKIADILIEEPESISNILKQHLNSGESFAKSRERALAYYFKELDLEQSSLDQIDISSIISSPNNILGIEYIKAIKRLKSKIIPLTIKRYKTGYHDLIVNDNIASATAIRNLLQEHINLNKSDSYYNITKNLLPTPSFNIMTDETNAGRGPIFSEHFDIAILSNIRKMKKAELAQYNDVNEGLQNRILTSINESGSVMDAVRIIKTKRYTHTRLMRIMFNTLIGLDKPLFDNFNAYGGPQYIRILGMNINGKTLLKLAYKKAVLPIIIKPSKYKESCNPLLKKMIELDFLATDLYTLSYNTVSERRGGLDLITSPVITHQ